jgi:hypothetical protein
MSCSVVFRSHEHQSCEMLQYVVDAENINVSSEFVRRVQDLVLSGKEEPMVRSWSNHQ